MPAAHDPYSALRVPLFRRFLVASLLVSMGTAAQGLAIGWEVYDRTGQALSLGMVGLVQAIPMLPTHTSFMVRPILVPCWHC